MTPSRMSTASAAPAAQDGREPRCCSSARGSATCPCDREGDAAAADRDRPASAEDVNAQRVARFADSITENLGSDNLDLFRGLVESYARDNDVAMADIAAALALETRDGGFPDGTRSAPGERPPREPLLRGAPRGAVRSRPTDRRWAQAEGHPGRLSGRSPTRADSRAGTSATSASATTSLVELPADLDAETLAQPSTPASDATPSTCGETWARRAPVGPQRRPARRKGWSARRQPAVESQSRGPSRQVLKPRRGRH